MNIEKIKFCYDAAYCNYRKISLKARCSMAPRNCPFEARETITLQTGKKITIYYCTLNEEKFQEEKKGGKFQKEKNEKKFQNEKEEAPQCRLSGG
jgi:hypothetical protein